VKVLIFDGSDNPIVEGAFAGMADIFYTHAPVSYLERMKRAAATVSTNFAASISDDEVFLPGALESSIRFLKKNSVMFRVAVKLLEFTETWGEFFGHGSTPNFQALI
jgi:hypothetical protein